MRSVILQAIVQTGGKVELSQTGLDAGDTVDVILLPRVSVKGGAPESIVEILNDAPGGLMFKSKEDVDRYLAEEHASWER